MRYSVSLKTIEELEDIDKKRKEDGFKPKIKKRKIVSRSGKGIIIPTTDEEKLIHVPFSPEEESGGAGSGDGEEGEVVGEEEIHGEGAGQGPGQGDGGDHGIEENAYEVGKKLTEEFELPDLEDKGKRVPVNEYTLDFTDRHKGSGQVVNKPATMKSIVKTNLALGRLDKDNVDTSKFIVVPGDIIYNTLSQERAYKSMAIVFFVRDYSGSMSGIPAEIVVVQHSLAYFWLMYQYENLVIPRFIVHDTEAKEVPTFEEYRGLRVAGGTRVYTGFEKVNQIVEEEGLANDYNIYVFYGTDGDDWDRDGAQAVSEIRKIMNFVNRMGVLIISERGKAEETTVAKYIIANGLLSEYESIFKAVLMDANHVDEAAIVESLKKLISGGEKK
ncbi:MAG: DUF444 family protein [Patescibacteria group bacterium]